MPVKSFAAAKVRLAEALTPAERVSLARSMAQRVVAAAGELPVSVVCDDEEVAAWARSRRAKVIWTPGLGLNGAVAVGVERLVAGGADRVIVAHADLPLARDLAHVAEGFDGVTLVPDRHEDGTNVVCLPAAAVTAGFTFAYGPGSFARHRAEARRLSLAVRVLRDEHLGWDVDEPGDLPLPTTCA